MPCHAETARELFREILLRQTMLDQAEARYREFNQVHGVLFTDEFIVYDDKSQHYYNKTKL